MSTAGQGIFLQASQARGKKAGTGVEGTGSGACGPPKSSTSSRTGFAACHAAPCHLRAKSFQQPPPQGSSRWRGPTQRHMPGEYARPVRLVRRQMLPQAWPRCYRPYSAGAQQQRAGGTACSDRPLAKVLGARQRSQFQPEAQTCSGRTCTNWDPCKPHAGSN